jgi:hypothetical protein
MRDISAAAVGDPILLPDARFVHESDLYGARIAAVVLSDARQRGGEDFLLKASMAPSACASRRRAWGASLLSRARRRSS